MKFQNEQWFKAWLDEKLKNKEYDFEEFLKDVEKRTNELGLTDNDTGYYEFSSFETNNGRAETYCYTVQIIQGVTTVIF